MFKGKKKKADEIKTVTYDDENDFEAGGEEAEEEIEAPVQTRRTKPNTPQSKEGSELWVVREVPTETQRVLYNRKTKEGLDLYSAIAKILNRIEEE